MSGKLAKPLKLRGNHDTKAGEAGITYTWELGDQETIFGRMCNEDVVLDIIKYEPVKVGWLEPL